MAGVSGAEKPEYIYDNACMEVKYYDMLYDFAGVVTKANEQSFEGMTPEHIAGTLRRAAEAFCRLCMLDGLTRAGSEEKSQDHKESRSVSERQEEKPLPDNFLRIDKDGWGLCPVCNSKVLKVTATTRLENFPVFCKRCRADHLVNWWNAENQRIMYRRYVNERYIREQALKGTGLRSFNNTYQSATERVAVKRS